VSKSRMMLRARALASALALAAIGGGCASPGGGASGGGSAAHEVGEPERDARQAARRFMAARKVEGLSIAVADSSGVLWAEGFGRARKGASGAFTERTPSFPGSATKVITATAVMILADRGLVDLDAPLARYLPDFSIRTAGWSPEAITVRSLLTHHSGLPSDRFRSMISLRSPSSLEEKAQGLPALLAREWAAREPGRAFSYSNLSYSLLGLLVERVSGESLAAFVKAEILDPLGMVDSLFDFQEADRAAASPGYLRGKIVQTPFFRDLGAGGFLTSAADMGRFTAALLAIHRGEPGILRPEILRAMWTRQNGAVAADLDFSIGLAWWLGPFDCLPGESVVAHGGDWPPFASLTLILPERDLAVFVLANSVEGSGSMALEGLALEALQAFARGRPGPALPPSPVVTTKRELPAQTRDAALGDWASPWGMIRIRARGRGATVSFAGKMLDAVWRSDGRLGMEYRLLGLSLPVFELGEYSLSLERVGEAVALGFRCHGVLQGVCERISPMAPAPAWAARAGSYRLEGEDPDCIVSEPQLRVDAAGHLLLCYRFLGGRAPREYPLEALSATEARLRGSGRNLGEVVEAETDGSLRWSGFSLRRR
jgi:CubicO group peptidase (beta-lactamase class C family)